MSTPKSVQHGPLTPGGDPIMGGKLRVPDLKSWLLVRPRLLDLFSLGVREPLTLVNAPAGSGKTVLATSWVSGGTAPGPVIWLSLDDEDGRSGIFWSYVLAGLARAGIDVADVAGPHLVDRVDRSLLVHLAAQLSERPEPVILILDNADGLSRQQVTSEIDFVLRHAAGQLRLVLITRTDPHLPLHQYRLDGSVTEIRFPDLAFTPEEAKALLEGHKVHLTDSALLAFTRHTKGWAAGLRLAGVPCGRRTRSGAEPNPAAGGDEDIAAYFRAEVLAGQTRDVQHFLLTTSVADRLWPGLAVYLSGLREAPAILRVLAEADAFLERLPDGPDAYRFHPLIRELLVAELRQQYPTRYRRLCRKAARWLAAAGRPVDAVRQWAAAQDWEDAAAVLVRDVGVSRLLATEASADLPAVFAEMPATTPGPQAAVIRAALALLRYDLDGATKLLLRAGEIVPDGPDDQALALRLAIAVTGAVLAAASGDSASAAAAIAAARLVLAEQAAEEVAARSAGPPPRPELHALLLWSAGRTSLVEGDIDAARATLAAAAQAANNSGSQYLRAQCLAQLALAEAVVGHLRRAGTLAHRAAVVLQARGGAATASFVADVALAWVSTEQADSRQARSHIEAALAMPEPYQEPIARGALALVRSRALRGRGDLAGAVGALSAARSGTVPLPPWLLDRLAAAETVLLVAQGRPEAALRLVSQMNRDQPPEAVLARGWAVLAAGSAPAAGQLALQVLEHPKLPLDLRIDALLLTAASELDRSRPETAKAALNRAVRLAEPEQLRRPFEEATIRVRRILREHPELTAADNRQRNGSPTGAGAEPVTGADMPIQPLTGREQEVLTYLAALLPTEEIAGRMFVSVNTVKTHVRAILRKLSAERRNDAVRRARELGLV